MFETLPKELSVRAPTIKDVGSIVELMNACDIAEQAEPEYTVEDLRADWQLPEVNPETDAWAIVAPGEQLVGYSCCCSTGRTCDYTHAPTFTLNIAVGVSGPPSLADGKAGTPTSPRSPSRRAHHVVRHDQQN